MIGHIIAFAAGYFLHDWRMQVEQSALLCISSLIFRTLLSRAASLVDDVVEVDDHLASVCGVWQCGADTRAKLITWR